MSEPEIHGLLMSVSTTFCRLMKYNFKPEEKGGEQLIPLFLDTVLLDSCSPEVRRAFVQAFAEQYAKIDKAAA